MARDMEGYGATSSVGLAETAKFGPEFGQIISIMRQRRSNDSALFAQMHEVRDRYNGDIVLPLTDVDKQPTFEPPVPRLIAQAVDGHARKASSSRFAIETPRLGSGKRYHDEAVLRRKVLNASWLENDMDLKQYRFYRQMAAYGTGCMVVMPDFKTGHAKVELRDPLCAYPELRDPSDIRLPTNVGFIFGRSIDWLTQNYPKQTYGFFQNSAGRNWDTLWDVVEWIDEECIVIGVLGPRQPAYQASDSRPMGYSGFELERWPNHAGCVPVVIPRRITLDRVAGQLQAMVSTVDYHARLAALSLTANEKHIFPDMVVMSEQGMVARVVGGEWADGRTGKVNVIQNARSVELLQVQVPPGINEQVQELEGAIRESTGASGMFGGQNPQGLRTGRAISEMSSFSIDPMVEESQKVGAAAFRTLFEAVIEVEKGYFPTRKHYVITGLPGDEEAVEYKPEQLLSSKNRVTYPLPGADIPTLSVSVGQLVGSKILSRTTGRILHPMVPDPDFEEFEETRQTLLDGLTAGIATQFASGQFPPEDAANILKIFTQSHDLPDALAKAHQEAQQRQATAAQPPGPDQANSPQQNPGLALPGAGAEQPAPGSAQQAQQLSPIPGPPPGLMGYRQLSRALQAAPMPAPTGGPAGG